MKKLLLPIIVLLLLAGFKDPDSRTITGIVSDENDGLPIEGASIMVLPSKGTTTTDENGKFKIVIGPHDKTIAITSVGYLNKTVKLTKAHHYQVKLKEFDSKLEEVVITGLGTARKESSMAVVPALSGRIAGLSASPEAGAKHVKIRGSIADSKHRSTGETSTLSDKDSKQQVQVRANQLTAGEWNDLENWDFWKDLMNNQDWSTQQPHWGFYTQHRVSVELKDKKQNPLPNLMVSAMANDKILWTAQSNYAGRAELWPALYHNTRNDFTLVVTAPNGEKIYEQEYDKNIRDIKLKLNEERIRIKNLDIMFMVDATGSMGDEIAYLKAELKDIIARLGNEDKLSVRTGMVFYRDRGDEYVTRAFDFDSNFDKVQHNLSKQYANGGGDFEEAVEEAMKTAIIQQSWTTNTATTKLMFMILDAPPHYDAQKIKSIQQSAKAAAAKGITLIPLVASGIDKPTEFLMRFLAMSTNGTYVFITDDSGIGNAHLKPTTGKYKVEYLNELMYRLIRKYTGLDTNMAKDLLTIAEGNNATQPIVIR